MSKSALTTLNRLLGKKNKDKAAQPNGKFSKSSSNLSISATNLNDTSQLEYNRITPLPIATSNAPFEQTFRITVLLPKDQLYVCRLGARVPLSKLLELVCENKLLDPEKYEFRNPVDASQIYDCDLTIGAVGLSEIRLCSKSESYDNFNADEMIKLQRTTIIRDSLSSSEFSSRNSKSQITTKTPSPYSSSNSLNSMDSTGMNYTRTPVVPTTAVAKVQQQQLQQQQSNLTRQISNTSTASAKIAAPPRKKRAAPRPPSQMVIPEKSTLDLTDSKDVEQTIDNLKSNSTATLPRKDYFVSTPNLVSAQDSSMDCNGNVKLNGEHDEQTATAEQQQIEQMNARNLYSASVQDLSSSSSIQMGVKLPEPSPRKRVVPEKKKKSSAPAPPPRGGGAVYSDNEDAMSIASTATSFSENLSTAPATPQTPNELKPQLVVPPDSEHDTEQSVTKQQQPQPSPTPMKRETVVTTTTTTSAISSTTSTTTKESTIDVSLSKTSTTSITPSNTTNEQPAPIEMPKPVPRQTSTTLLNATPTNDVLASSESTTKQRIVNVSKVMLNRTPTPEPRSLSTEPSSELDLEDDDNRSKQADSGIGEPVPSPIPDSLPSEGSAHECKSTFESSSDDDDIVKVYNFKLCKTVKPLGEHKTLEDLTQLTADDVSGQSSPVTLVPAESKSTHSSTDTTSWNFAIPISPPANFADISQKSLESRTTAESEDAPIQPKIKERPVLDFNSINTDSLERKTTLRNIPMAAAATRTPMPSPATPINEMVGELSTIINENRMDSLIKQAKAEPEIESAKRNTLSNFSIGAISQHSSTQHSTQHQQHSKTSIVETFESSTMLLTNGNTNSSPTSEDDSKLYRKRGSITNLTSLQQQRKSLTRADSFQQPTAAYRDETKEGLNSRSSSHLCLTKIEQNGLQNSKRRSSSELSIGESPSLQSLEIIKTILNSRKNSLANSGSDSESKEATQLAPAVRETVAAATKRIETAAEPQAERVAVKEAEPSKVVETAEPKDIPKTYRYSGPPSINFSTWSERPKVQVAIKNEGDYIFGGQQAASKSAGTTEATKTMPRNYRVSTPAGTFNFNNAQNEIKRNPVSPPIAPKPDSTTARMGIPEKEFKVPITVKPLADVIVTTNQQQIAKTKSELNTTSAKVEYNVSKQNSISTLPRNFGNKRFSTPVTSAATVTTTQQSSAKVEVPGPALLRSRSISKAETESDKRVTVAGYGNTTTTPTTAESTVPFGQGTLRRTGFKEKMLAIEQQEKSVESTVTTEKVVKTPSQEQAPIVSNSFKTTLRLNSTQSPSQAGTSTTVLTNGYGYASSTTATLKTTTSSTSTTTSSKSSSKTSIQSGDQFQFKIQANASAKQGSTSNELKQERTLQSPKSAPVQAATPTPPPPPAMSGLKLKSIKSMPNPSSNSKNSVDGDPHDALLAAIRNFKKDNLNRV